MGKGSMVLAKSTEEESKVHLKPPTSLSSHVGLPASAPQPCARPLRSRCRAPSSREL